MLIHRWAATPRPQERLEPTDDVVQVAPEEQAADEATRHNFYRERVSPSAKTTTLTEEQECALPFTTRGETSRVYR